MPGLYTQSWHWQWRPPPGTRGRPCSRGHCRHDRVEIRIKKKHCGALRVAMGPQNKNCCINLGEARRCKQTPRVASTSTCRRRPTVWWGWIDQEMVDRRRNRSSRRRLSTYKFVQLVFFSGVSSDPSSAVDIIIGRVFFANYTVAKMMIPLLLFGAICHDGRIATR